MLDSARKRHDDLAFLKRLFKLSKVRMRFVRLTLCCLLMILSTGLSAPARATPPPLQRAYVGEFSARATPTVQSNIAKAAHSATSRLAQIQARGQLVVGVTYDLAPFGFVEADGTVQGFDVDLSREFARRWLGDANALVLVRVTAATAIPLLMAGHIDLIAAALPTDVQDRAQIDFSQPYFVDGESVLTRSASGVQSWADLDQKVVAITGGSRSSTDIATLIDDPTIAPLWLPFQEYRTAQQALLMGQVDAVIGSSIVFSQTVQGNAEVKIAVDRFRRQAYAVGIPHLDVRLRDQVNVTLQAMQADGVYDALYLRWFNTTPAALAQWATVAQAQVEIAQNSSPVAIDESTTVLADASSAVSVETLSSILVPTATPLSTPLPLTATPVPLPTATAAAQVTATVDFPAVIAIRPGGSADARHAPLTTSPILVTLASDTYWSVLQLSADRQWVQLQLAGDLRAWVPVELVMAAETALPTPQR